MTAAQKLAALRAEETAAAAKAKELADKRAALEAESRKEINESRIATLNTLPGLLGVDSLAVAASLALHLAKHGNLDSAQDSAKGDRKERVVLDIAGKLAVLESRTGDDALTLAATAEKHKISLGTVQNICAEESRAAIIKQAKEDKIALPPKIAALQKSAKPAPAKV